jgi:hypothetical protein
MGIHFTIDFYTIYTSHGMSWHSTLSDTPSPNTC